MDYFNYEKELVVALMNGGATPDAIEVMGKIEPCMFSSGYLRECYLAILDLYKKGLPFTMLEVSDKTEIPLADLVEVAKGTAGHARGIKSYAKRVRQGYYLRQSRDKLSEVVLAIDSIRDESQIGEIAEAVEVAVKNLVIETDTKKPRKASEILEQYVDIIEQRYMGGEYDRRLKTGVESIDKITQGFNLTDLVIIAGCPGMGKTEFMMKIVNGCSNKDGGALVFSMEMDEYQLIERSVAIEADLPISCARNPNGMNQEDMSKFTAGMGRVKEKQFFVLDQAGLTANEIYAQAMEHKTRFPETRAFFIDYVGLIELQKADRHDIALGDVSRKLKKLAKDTKTPVFLLAQVTSKVVEGRQNKRPMASDLKDSSRLQDDADWIIFPYRDEVYNKDSTAAGIAEINFAKARHGAGGTVYMQWRNGHFKEIDQAQAHHVASQSEQSQSQKGQGRAKDF